MNKLHPILFQPDMIQAILDNRKTQTRRIIKPQPPTDADSYTLSFVRHPWHDFYGHNDRTMHRVKCPYGQPGNVLWVRETWAVTTNINRMDGWPGRPCTWIGDEDEQYECYIYRADGKWQWLDDDGSDTDRSHWKPSLFMPYEACRLWLRITDVRAERLQDISEEDAIAEGYSYQSLHAMHEEAAGMNLMRMPDDPLLWYSELWKGINGPDSWSANPFVWAISFERTEKP